MLYNQVNTLRNYISVLKNQDLEKKTININRSYLAGNYRKTRTRFALELVCCLCVAK